MPARCSAALAGLRRARFPRPPPQVINTSRPVWGRGTAQAAQDGRGGGGAAEEGRRYPNSNKPSTTVMPWAHILECPGVPPNRVTIEIKLGFRPGTPCQNTPQTQKGAGGAVQQYSEKFNCRLCLLAFFEPTSGRKWERQVNALIW